MDGRTKTKFICISSLLSVGSVSGSALVTSHCTESGGGGGERRRRFIFTRSSFSPERASAGEETQGGGLGGPRTGARHLFLLLPRSDMSFRTCGHSARSLFLSFSSSAVTAQAAGLESFASVGGMSHSNVAFLGRIWKRKCPCRRT